MKDLAFASIKLLREKLASKEISKKELLDLTIERCKEHDDKLGGFLEIFDRDTILSGLDEFDTGSEGIVGGLEGICGAIKDVICQKNRTTACASKMLESFVSPYDATVVSSLKSSGAFCIGRANCDEFAMGSSCELSAFKKTVNPWNFSCVPGGSSGGSAALVAAGLVPWSLGSETGGSVRLPASWCGVVGLKPTYGLVSRFGLVAYASSLDQISPVTRTVYDNALVLSCIAGNDPNDSSSQDISKIDYTRSLDSKIRPGLKLGVVENALKAGGLDGELRDSLEGALKQFEKLGVELVPLKLPLMDFGAAIYLTISRAELASNLARFDGVRYGFRDKEAETLREMYMDSRGKGLGSVVKQRILVGNYVLSAGYADEYYNLAKKVQKLLRAQFLEAFKSVDVLFAPVAPIPAFEFGKISTDSLAYDLIDYFTCPANLTGIPAISVPCGFTKNGLPIGFQIIGKDFSEELLYQVAYAYEQSMHWYQMHPQMFR